MREVLYAMRFAGQAAPSGEGGNVLTAATRAPSSSLTSVVDADGLITSNFFVDDRLGVVDHHFGVLLLSGTGA